MTFLEQLIHEGMAAGLDGAELGEYVGRAMAKEIDRRVLELVEKQECPART